MEFILGIKPYYMFYSGDKREFHSTRSSKIKFNVGSKTELCFGVKYNKLMQKKNSCERLLNTTNTTRLPSSLNLYLDWVSPLST